jgi:hypothetical protein
MHARIAIAGSAFIGVCWPGFMWKLWRRTGRFEPSEYHLRAA